MNRSQPLESTIPDFVIEVRQPGERGADATLVLNFGDAVYESMDITFQPPGNVARGMDILNGMIEAASAAIDLSKSSRGGS